MKWSTRNYWWQSRDLSLYYRDEDLEFKNNKRDYTKHFKCKMSNKNSQKFWKLLKLWYEFTIWNNENIKTLVQILRYPSKFKKFCTYIRGLKHNWWLQSKIKIQVSFFHSSQIHISLWIWRSAFVFYIHYDCYVHDYWEVSRNFTKMRFSILVEPLNL